jgi:hypothetical protein
MKIIFLVIDGVLNSHQYDSGRGTAEGNIDVSRILLLKRLVNQMGAKIVLTSSWRRHWDSVGGCTGEIGKELEDTFGRFGICLYDNTPELDNDRLKEIGKWLAANQDVTAFVVIDDIKFGWYELAPFVVNTDYRIGRGLEERHIKKTIKILLKSE